MTSYSQPQQKVPSQGKQLSPQLQQQQQKQQQKQLQQQLQQQKQLLPQLQLQLQKQKPQQLQQQEEKQQILLELQRLQQQQWLPETTEKEEREGGEEVEVEDDVPSLNDIWKFGPDVLRSATTALNQTSQVQATINTPPSQTVLLDSPPSQTVFLNPPPDSKPLPDDPWPFSKATKDGCNIHRPVFPEWVSVKPDWLKTIQPYNATVVAEGVITQSLYTIAHHEWPFSHHSHDNAFHVKLDKEYTGLASVYHPVDGDGLRTMEMEWEIGTDNTGKTDRFPTFFWPWEGDRVWMMGRWVWDCGHFDPFRGNNWKSEVHPPFATAFTRNEPAMFPGENKPSSAAVTYIWIHGRGGNFDTLVGGRNYEFDVPTLPKPSNLPGAQLKYKVSYGFGGNAPPIVTPKSQLCDFAGTGEMTPCAHVVIPLSGIPKSKDLKYGAIVTTKWIDPTLPVQPTEGFRKLRVTFDSIKINYDHETDITTPSPFCPKPPGSIFPKPGPIFPKPPPPPGCTPKRAPGEWDNLWVGVNGKWIELSGPNYRLHEVYDGDVKVFPAGRKFVDVIVPESGELKIQTTGWENDNDGYFGHSYWWFLALPFCCIPYGPTQVEAADDNDKIGVLRHYYCSTITADNKDRCDGGANFGVRPQPYDEKSNYSVGGGTGDFNLRYRIEQLGFIPPDKATLPPGQLPTKPPTTKPPVAQPPVKPPTTPPEQQLPPICKIRPWLPQCKDLM